MADKRMLIMKNTCSRFIVLPDIQQSSCISFPFFQVIELEVDTGNFTS